MTSVREPKKWDILICENEKNVTLWHCLTEFQLGRYGLYAGEKQLSPFG